MVAFRLVLIAILLAMATSALTRAAPPDGGAEQYEGRERIKRDPLGFNARGFHDDIFGQDFGVFHTVKRVRSLEQPKVVQATEGAEKHDRFKREADGAPEMSSTSKAMEHSKRRPEMGSSGFHGDTFSGGFGEFWTMKKNDYVKRDPEVPEEVGYSDMWSEKRAAKERRMNEGYTPDEVTAIFRGEQTNYMPHVSTESDDAREMLKDKSNWQGIDSAQKPYMKAIESDPKYISTHMKGDVIPQEYIEENGLMKGKSPQVSAKDFEREEFAKALEQILKTKRGFHFEKLRKRRPEMGASGFHGNMFSNGFGEFWPMKKNGGTSAFYRDTGYEQPRPLKRRPEMDSLGFHGDTFHNGFGDFWPMKRSIYSGNFAKGEDEANMEQDECCVADEKPDGKMIVH